MLILHQSYIEFPISELFTAMGDNVIPLNVVRLRTVLQQPLA